MEHGTMGELMLTRSVIKHIRKHNKGLELGAGVGNDYSCVRLMDNREDTGDIRIVNTEAVADKPYTAWVKALNNMAVSGAVPVGVRLVIMLPSDTEERQLKDFMSEFNELADAEELQIMGGHTQVSNTFASPCFCVTAVGAAGEYRADAKGIKPGFDIVMTKYAGLMGTDILARENYDTLKERFSESYIKGAFADRSTFSISKEAALVSQSVTGVKYMHDVSYGGVYGALWQLGAAVGCGLYIEHNLIPVRQETIELCEFYDLNPYMLEGTGSLLIVAENGEAVVQCLKDDNIEAAVIGRVTEGRDRVVMTGSEKRFLAPVKGDEIYFKEKRYRS